MIALAALACALLAQAPPPAPPPDASDLAEHLIVRFGVSYDPVFGSVLGSDANLRLASQPLSGNLALGTRGLLLPMLHSYALGQGVIELAGAPTVSTAEDPHAERPLHPLVAHRYPDARAVLLHLAYAELDGLSTEGALAHLHLRGGRQFHFGAVGVTFDGATLGYDSPRFSVAVRGGQRAAPYDRSSATPERADTTPGLVLGGDARYRLGDDRLSLELRVEYLHFERTLGLVARDRALAGGATVEQATDLGELTAELAASDALLATVRASLVGAELSHVRGQLSYTWGRTALFVDLDQKVGADLFFDLSSGTGVLRAGRPSTLETYRLGIPDARPYSDARASLLFDLGDALELEPSVGGRLVLGDEAERSPYDASRVVWGLAARGRWALGRRGHLELSGDYAAVLYLRPDGAVGTFRDAAAGGESLVHDVTVGVRYVRRGEYALPPRDGRALSQRTISVGAYGFVSASRIDNRNTPAGLDQVDAGGGVDVRWTIARTFSLTAAYEVARGPRTFPDDPGLFHGFRGGLQAQF